MSGEARPPGLAAVATSSLERLRDGLGSERLRAPLSHADLVWTGPEGEQASARDTAVVLRRLFESARDHVVLAGYSFRDAPSVLGPLHEGMRARGVTARFFVDVAQPEAGGIEPEEHGQRALAGFVRDNWRFGPPYPEIYCDRRALLPGPPWSSLHAKCVSVDGRRAFVSSANFTSRGQERNIEADVLLHDSAFAAQLERQLLSLVEGGFVLAWDGAAASQR